MASEEARARFLANPDSKLPPREGAEPTTKSGSTSRSLARKPLARGAGPKRTGRPKQESVKQAILNARWAGIREATIYWMNKLDPDGAHCMGCGRKARHLDLDHVVPRSRGGHYTVSNSQLLCRDCHSQKHGRPEWSKGESA